ncbi:MAG: hypothetical protein IPP72_02665 [Chitinophagaceae bacterium]|nr:hypothetical protein [Chitinophagaceae bacterium]
MNGFDVGIPVGVGYVFAKTVGINFRYCHGLSNVNKNDPAKDHNRVFLLRLFWVLGH